MLCLAGLTTHRFFFSDTGSFLCRGFLLVRVRVLPVLSDLIVEVLRHGLHRVKQTISVESKMGESGSLLTDLLFVENELAAMPYLVACLMTASALSCMASTFFLIVSVRESLLRVR